VSYSFVTGQIEGFSRKGNTHMHLLLVNVAACAVAFVYCIYQTHRRLIERKQQQLRKRVSYLLWVTAQRAGCEEALMQP
jgi:hypothetical protein